METMKQTNKHVTTPSQEDLISKIFNIYLYREPLQSELEYYKTFDLLTIEQILANSEEHKMVQIVERVLNKYKVELPQ